MIAIATLIFLLVTIIASLYTIFTARADSAYYAEIIEWADNIRPEDHHG